MILGIVLFLITALTAVSVTGFSGQGASDSQVSAVQVVQGKLCSALLKTLPVAMKPVKNTSTGYDPKTQDASCTAIDPHDNAASLYEHVPNGLKANRSAYQANVQKDMGLSTPDYGCSLTDRGQLDTSPQNAIPGTKTSFGCNITVGTNNLGTRVDAITNDGHSVTFSMYAAPSVLRDQSALMVAQSAIALLSKAPA